MTITTNQQPEPSYLRLLIISTLIFILLCISFLLIMQFNGWKYIGVPAISQEYFDLLFADLRAVLSASDCHQLGHDVFYSNPCDPWERVHVYGTIFLELSHLGLTVDDNRWLGWSLIMTFWISSLWIIRPSNGLESITTLLFLLSPAILLGAERANNDLFIFILLAIVTTFISVKTGFIRHFMGASVLFLAAIAKLFPSAAFIALLIYRWKTKPERWLWASASFAFFAWVILNFQDIQTIAEVSPKPRDGWTFGIQMLFIRIFHIYDSSLLNVLALVGITGLTIIAFAILRKHPLQTKNVSEFIKINYLVGFSALLFCFVVTSNYDYRNIFFLPLLPLLFIFIQDPQYKFWRQVSLFALALYLVVVWIEIFPTSNTWILIEQIASWLVFIPLIAIAIQVSGLYQRICHNIFKDKQ